MEVIWTILQLQKCYESVREIVGKVMCEDYGKSVFNAQKGK